MQTSGSKERLQRAAPDMLAQSSQSMDDELDSAIGVFARVRPGSEMGVRDPSITVRKRYEVQQDIQVRNLEFSMEWVFDSDATQEEVYEVVAERRVAKMLQGYNVCLLAYGQTGSGKTCAAGSRASATRAIFLRPP